MLDYCRAVVSGKQPASKYTRLACQRQIDDLRRKGWRWCFDPDKAERVCKFIELLPHTKGEWAKRRQRISLEPWQCFVECTVFGWIDPKSGTRRFRRADVYVPRKNGKSIVAAANGLYAFVADGEAGAEVYCGASTEKQAWEVFRPAKQIVTKLDDLRSHFGVTAYKAHLQTDDNDRMEPVIGDPPDGSSPSCAIIDEYHEHKSNAQVETMETGMGARRNPIMWVFTTAGFDLGSPCYASQLELRKELDDAVHGGGDDRRFGVIYEIDEGDDPYSIESLKKANPNYGVSIFDDFLETQARQAKESPRKQNSYLTKHCNVWVGARTAWLNMVDWRACEDDSFDLADLDGERIVSFDLSSRLDFTAIVHVVQVEQDNGWHYYVEPEFWLPSDRVHDEETGRYRSWHAAGLINTCEGAEILHDDLEESLRAASERGNLAEYTHDPWHAATLAQRLSKDGAVVVEYRQTVMQMSEPMKELEAAIKARRLHVKPNAVMQWMASNVVCREDAKGNIFPRKDADENKIDGMVALIMGIGRAMSYQGGDSFDDWLSEIRGDTEAA